MKILEEKEGFKYSNGEIVVSSLCLPDGEDETKWQLIPNEEAETLKNTLVQEKKTEFINTLDDIGTEIMSDVVEEMNLD
jgi:hypothetical protein